MTLIRPDWFFHAANLLMLAAYTVRDVLWLRVFAICASLIALPYYFLQPHTLWTPIVWCGVFVSMNLFRSWRLLLERRPVQLTKEEEQTRRLAFSDLRPRQVLELLSLGSWDNLEPGTHLVEEGHVPKKLALIVRGVVRISREGRVICDLHAGDLVGSALVLNGLPADLDAVVLQPLRVVRWELPTLLKYLSARPEVRTVLQKQLARDLASKLERVVAA